MSSKTIPESRPKTRGGLTPIGTLLPVVAPPGMRPRGYNPEIAAALIPLTSPLDADRLQLRVRREVHRWVEQIIERAIFRAERRTRRVPWHVGRGMKWVTGQRRQIAYDVVRALAAHGAGDQLSRRFGEIAGARFPRDGQVIDDRPRTPRLEGTNPRAVGSDLRTRKKNPRAVGSSPRQRRRPSTPPAADDAAAALRAAE